MGADTSTPTGHMHSTGKSLILEGGDQRGGGANLVRKICQDSILCSYPLSPRNTPNSAITGGMIRRERVTSRVDRYSPYHVTYTIGGFYHERVNDIEALVLYQLKSAVFEIGKGGT